MHTTKYLIVGAGMTGDMAAKGIRDNDPDGSITLIGADPHPPYKRPLLTKGLGKGAPEEKLWREPAEGVELVTGCRRGSRPSSRTTTGRRVSRCSAARWSPRPREIGSRPAPGARSKPTRLWRASA